MIFDGCLFDTEPLLTLFPNFEESEVNRMATQLAPASATRVDGFLIAPEDVVIVADQRGRHYAPSDRDIVSLAISIYCYGQIQPISIRLVSQPAKNTPQVNAGFTRVAACRLLKQGFTVPDDYEPGPVPEGYVEEVAEGAEQAVPNKVVNPGDFVQVPDIKISCTVGRFNEREALERNIIENRQRSATSPIDDAYNHRHLRSLGYTTKQIIALYDYNSSGYNIVSTLASLLEHDDATQLLIHQGILPVASAVDLLKLPAADRKKAIADAKRASGKVASSAVAEAVRTASLSDYEHANEIGEAAGESQGGSGKKAPQGTKSRGLKELRNFLKARTGADAEFEYVKPLADVYKTLDLWLRGLRTDETLERAFDACFDAVPDEFEDAGGDTTAKPKAKTKKPKAAKKSPKPLTAEELEKQIADEVAAEMADDEVNDAA